MFSFLQRKTLIRFRSLTLGSILLLGLWGCGPIYDTRYTFSPPQSSEGKTCTFQCNQIKLQCQQLEDMNNDRCQRDSERERRDCEWEIRMTKGREPKWYECGGSSCSVDYARCEETYRSCYESCGGKIVAERVCVMNCEGAPR